MISLPRLLQLPTGKHNIKLTRFFSTFNIDQPLQGQFLSIFIHTIFHSQADFLIPDLCETTKRTHLPQTRFSREQSLSLAQNLQETY